jgi:hypothetical protein
MADEASFSDLRAQVETAREEYHLALKAERDVSRHYTGLPHPDGAQHMHHTHEALKLALERYTQALRDLTDYVLKRTHHIRTNQ